MEDAERIRDAYAAFVRGDVEQIVSLQRPDFELHEEPELPGGRVWHGPEGFRSYMNEAGARWRELTVELDDVTEVDASTFVVSGTLRGTGLISGAGVDASFGHVVVLRDGMAVRMHMFFERERAIAAARVELVRGIFDGFARGDFASAVELYQPDLEWIEHRSITGHGHYRGLAELREGFLEWLGAWDGYRCEAEDLTGAGEQVVVSVKGSGKGKLSGVEASERFFMVFSFRDGKVARIENHRQRPALR